MLPLKASVTSPAPSIGEIHVLPSPRLLASQHDDDVAPVSSKLVLALSDWFLNPNQCKMPVTWCAAPPLPPPPLAAATGRASSVLQQVLPALAGLMRPLWPSAQLDHHVLAALATLNPMDPPPLTPRSHPSRPAGLRARAAAASSALRRSICTRRATRLRCTRSTTRTSAS